MNFLAHFFLCADHAALTTGNFLGDFVKGKKYTQYPAPVAKGILMHREIDAFTDKHPSFLASKLHLAPVYGHYAGVVVDMFYDHLLARHWSEYSTQPLEQFISQVYRQLQAQQHLFPAPAARVYHYMVQHNWLQGYTQIAGIQWALEGIARRSAYAPDMSRAAEHFQQHCVALHKEFQVFFPQLTRHIAAFLP